MGAEIRAKGAREAAQKGAREADRCRNRSLVDRMEGYSGPAQPSPTIAQCLNGGPGWIEVECNRCNTRASQATGVPNGLKTTPVFVRGIKMPNTGEAGPVLNIFPAADGVQHCEIAGMRDTLDTYAERLPKWPWLQRYVGSMNWATQVRHVTNDAPLHPTVADRFALTEVVQCASVGPYRPEALRQHDNFKQLY